MTDNNKCHFCGGAKTDTIEPGATAYNCGSRRNGDCFRQSDWCLYICMRRNYREASETIIEMRATIKSLQEELGKCKRQPLQQS